MNNQDRNKLKSAEVLIKYTWLRNHEALKTTDCEIGDIDWDRILKNDWTFHEAILIEVLKFLLLEESNVSLDDLMALNEFDRQAVIVALNIKFSVNDLEENLKK